MKVKVLPPEAVEKIAAGEVVERPSSVVKELVENSLDSGAARIEVRFEEGGIKLIEVSDDGCGMSREDMIAALKRHATSKIRSFEDLETVGTLGFRGEALPSIAAVTRLSVISKEKGAAAAVELKMEGPGKPSMQPAARAAGTAVKAEELFFNLPARRKFLKSPSTERRHIISYLEDLAVISPDISLGVFSGGKRVLEYMPSTLRERFIEVAGRKLYDRIIDVEFENPYIAVKGFATVPQESFANRSKIRLYVNSRPVSSGLLLHSVMEAYRPFIPYGRYPAAALNILINPALIDVNVHPAKKEVRFINQQGVHQIISKVLRSLLEQSSAAFEAGPVRYEGKMPEHLPGPAYSGFKRGPGTGFEGQRDFDGIDLKEVTKFSFQGPSSVKEPSPGPLGIIPRFQFEKRYVVGEDRKGLVILDQHTAWERVNYERLKKEFSERRISSQGVLMPEVIEPGPARADLISENRALLREYGIEIEDFGPGIFRVTALPADTSSAAELIDEILDILEESGNAPGRDLLSDDIIKVIACRSSVMSGDSMSMEEMLRMVELLGKCSVPHRCPHGRPVILGFSREELDSRFGR